MKRRSQLRITLCDDLLLEILHFMTRRQLAELESVSRRFFRLIGGRKEDVTAPTRRNGLGPLLLYRFPFKMDVSVIEGGEVRFTFSKEEKMKDRFT
jgi:hypothetical protein